MENKGVLPEPFLGKIILFERGPCDRVLALKSALDQEWWIDAQRGRAVTSILAAIRHIPDSPDYDEKFGFHREIPHQGEVLGGGIALYLEGTFYLDCQSQAYGPLNRRLVADLLSHPSVRRLNDATVQIVSAPDGISTPFPYYLGQELIG